MTQNKLFPLLLTPLALIALFLAGVNPAYAEPAAARCGGDKTKAAAKYAKSEISCHASALRKGEAVDPDCTANATRKLEAAFDKAEAAGGCLTVDDESDVEADIAAALDAVQALLDPDAQADALKCASAKLRASSRHTQTQLNCYGRPATRDLVPSERCFTKADKRFASSFSKAERRGGCTTTDDAGAVAIVDEDAARSIVGRLSPVCGDTISGPSQECDGDDDEACPGLCDQSCLCDFPPQCGDGLAGLPEECDDGNLTDGDGCSSTCELEDRSALCTGVPQSPGTAIDAVLISDDFMAPTFLTAAPLDARRLFVTERRGTVRILNLEDGSVNETPFLDINELTTTGGERGLFSMAFDPDYEANGRFFISYTNTSGDLVLARYEVDAGNPDLADESTRQELLVVPHPGAANHNGGQLQFGVDGYLYWSMGDGGRGLNSQEDDTLLGKLLRTDVDHDAAPFVTVPASNPNYVDGNDELEYAWSKGLRNPWRFSFDRETGDLYIGDVGAGQREEISFAPGSSTGSENYGWNTFEGTRCARASCPDPPTGFTMPAYEYTHSNGCAVIGGYAYRGCAMPDYAGTYFFSDLCSTFVQTFEIAGGVAVNLTDRTDDARSAGASFTGVISWGEDARGEIYIITGNNRVYRIEPE